MESQHKYCPQCKKALPVGSFGKNRNKSGGLQTACKICRAKHAAQWYSQNKKLHRARAKVANKKTEEANKAWLYSYLLGHPCVDCAEADPVVLEFDHLHDKTYDVAYMLLRCSLKRLAAEVEKCEVRCANCHRKITAKRSNSWRHRASVAQR